MSNFKKALALVLKHEGGWVNNPRDPGGETNYGITIAVAKAHGYFDPMKDIPMATVEAIYQESYWHPRYEAIPFIVAFNIFDGNVNSGVGRSVRWMQLAVGAKVDGNFGPVSQSMVMQADPGALVLKYNSIRLRFLTGLGTWPTFGRGWAARIADNLNVSP